MAIYLGTNKVSMSGLIEKPDDVYGFMKNSRLIATKTWSCKLSDTDYASYTPSTTSQNLKFPATTYTTSASTTVTCLRIGEAYDGTIITKNAHDYVIICESIIIPVYTTTPSAPYQMKFVSTRDWQFGHYYGLDTTTGGQKTTITTGNSYMTSASACLIKTTTGYSASTAGFKGMYGYASIGTSSNKDYADLMVTSLSMQASTSYMPVDTFSNINAANTTITATWKIYEGDLNVYSHLYQNTYNKIAIE